MWPLFTASGLIHGRSYDLPMYPMPEDVNHPSTPILFRSLRHLAIVRGRYLIVKMMRHLARGFYDDETYGMGRPWYPLSEGRLECSLDGGETRLNRFQLRESQSEFGGSINNPW